VSFPKISRPPGIRPSSAARLKSNIIGRKPSDQSLRLRECPREPKSPPNPKMRRSNTKQSHNLGHERDSRIAIVLPHGIAVRFLPARMR
jgi:hypothetical protein